MPDAPFGIGHVSDTALMIAACRAHEAERPDAFTRDPFAARLAGERGMAIFDALPHRFIMDFGMAIRTKFIDDLVLEVAPDVSTVVNLGAGLDTRPWRLDLAPELRWIEVDFPEMLDYKEGLMATETPRCRRERLTADLADPAQRRAVYAAVGPEPALMITEGLLMYLPAAAVDALARESSAAHWISDLTTTTFSKALGGGGASRVIGHVQAEDHLEGEQILETIYRHGWRTAELRSYIRDLDFAKDRIAKMMASRPEPPRPQFSPDEPTGVHLFTRR
jgi:methyltransferase (TIGR00027 family)